MNDELKSPKGRWRTYVWYFLALAVLSAAAVIIPIIANLQQQLTPEQLSEARGRWKDNGPRSYDLRYLERIDSEEAGDEYQVKVRDGRGCLPPSQWPAHRPGSDDGSEAATVHRAGAVRANRGTARRGEGRQATAISPRHTLIAS